MPRSIARPLNQHQTKTVFLRAPSSAWPLVSAGKVSEFRAAVGNAPQLWRIPLPTLAVVYRRRLSFDRYDYRLMLLAAMRREALGAITPEGLRAAGYEGEDAFARFRREWMINEKRRFEPLRTVFVYTVRPVHQGDLDKVGRALIEHLYGEYIAQEAQTRPRTVQAERGPAQAVGGHLARPATGARA